MDKTKNPALTYRWFIYGLIIVVVIIRYTATGTGAVAPYLMSEFQMSGTDYGTFVSGQFLGYLALLLPVGVIVDMFGGRIVLSTGIFLLGVGVTILSISTSVAMLVTARVIIGCGASVVFLALMKIQTKWFSGKIFPLLTGINSGVSAFGMAIAFAPMAIMVEYLSWRVTYRVFAIVFFVLAALIFIFVRNKPEDFGFPAIVPEEVKVVKEKVTFKDAILSLAKNKDLRVLPFVLILVCVANGPFINYVVPYLTEVGGFDNVTANTIGMVFSVFQSASGFAAGAVASKTGRQKAILVTYNSVNIVLWSILAFTIPSAGLLWIVFPLIGFCASQIPTAFSIAKSLSIPLYAATAMSIMDVGFSLGSTLWPYLFGAVYDSQVAVGATPAQAYGAMFKYVVVAYIIAVVLLVFFVPEPSKVKAREAKLKGE